VGIVTVYGLDSTGIELREGDQKIPGIVLKNVFKIF